MFSNIVSKVFILKLIFAPICCNKSNPINPQNFGEKLKIYIL